MDDNRYAVIRLRDFRFFIFARLCITLGIHVQAVVVGWQIYSLTHDPLSLGMIGLAEAIPAISVSLYAGHLADIYDRKPIIQLCLFILCVASALLFYFSTPMGNWIVQENIFWLYSLIFLTGIARGFLSPAAFSFMPQLIPRPLYTSAISWNSAVWQAAALGGPMLGGFIYGFMGISEAYAADFSFLLLGFISIAFIPNRKVPESTSEENDILTKIGTGIRFVFSQPIVLSAISLDLFAVLFGGAVALLPIFAADILHVGEKGLGVLRSAPAVGAFLTALYITRHPIKRNTGKVLLWCVAGFGVSMIAFALSQNFFLSVFILAISGGFDSISVIVRSTLIHTLTPENMKGRVSAVNSIFIGSSNEIGGFESGVTAKWMGVVPSVIFGGVMTLFVVATTTWKAKELRRLDRVK